MTSSPLLPLGQAATNNNLAHTCMVPQDARKSRSRRKSTMRMNEAQAQDAYASCGEDGGHVVELNCIARTNTELVELHWTGLN